MRYAGDEAPRDDGDAEGQVHRRRDQREAGRESRRIDAQPAAALWTATSWRPRRRPEVLYLVCSNARAVPCDCCTLHIPLCAGIAALFAAPGLGGRERYIKIVLSFGGESIGAVFWGSPFFFFAPCGLATPSPTRVKLVRVDGFQSVDTVDTAHSMVLAPSRPLAPRSGAEENSQALPDVRRGPARAKRALPPPPTVPPALHSNGRPPKAAHKLQGVVYPAHVVQVVQVAPVAPSSTLTGASSRVRRCCSARTWAWRS